MRRFTKVCLITCGVSVVLGGGITAVAAGMGGDVSSTGWPAGSMGRSIAGFSEGIAGRFAGWPEELFGYTDFSRADVHEMKEGIKEGIRDGVEGIKEGVRDSLGNRFDKDDGAYDGAGEADTVSSDGQPAKEGGASDFAGQNAVRFPGREIRELKLEVNRGRAVILADSGSDEITVSGSSDRAMVAERNEKGQLKVKAGSDRWDNNRESGQVSVYIHVPRGFRFDKVELESKTGNRHWKDKGPTIKADGLAAGRLELNADVGTILVTGGDAGKLDISCDVASVSFEGGVSSEVEADCDVGSVSLTLAGDAADFNYDMKCDLGAINVGGTSVAGLSGKRSIDNGAAKRMELKCDTGSINVKFKGQ